MEGFERLPLVFPSPCAHREDPVPFPLGRAVLTVWAVRAAGSQVGGPWCLGQSSVGLPPSRCCRMRGPRPQGLGPPGPRLPSGAPLEFLLPQDSFLEAEGSGLKLGLDAQWWSCMSSLEMTLESPQGLEGSLWTWAPENPPWQG